MKHKKIKPLKKVKKYLQTTSLLCPDDYVSLDLEMTGLNPKEDEIIEIGALKIRQNKIVDKFQMLVKPSKLIPQRVEELTKITNEMVKDEGTIKEVLPKLLDFLQDDIIVGQNIGQDIEFLKTNLQKIDKDVDFKYVDTFVYSLILLPMLEKRNLSSLVSYFEIEENSEFHRAINDAYYTKLVYDKLREMILEQYGSYENFALDPQPALPKDSVLPKLATSKNVRIVAPILRLQHTKERVYPPYFTNIHGLQVTDKEIYYDKVDKDKILSCFSLDLSYNTYEKAYSEYKIINQYYRKHGKKLEYMNKTDAKACIAFSCLDCKEYFELREQGYSIYYSMDVVKVLQEKGNE